MAWLTGWKYCKKIKVPASDIDGALSNFPLTVYLNEDNFDFTKCKADGSDIRFTDGDLNPLKFERKEHNRPYATFDGSGDWFQFSSDSSMGASGDFTLEWSGYIEGNNSYAGLFHLANPSNQYTLFLEYSDTRGLLLHISPISITKSLTTKKNQKLDLVVSRKSGVVYIYENGILIHSTSNTTVMESSTLGGIGRESQTANSYYFYGKMFGVRYSVGIGRYDNLIAPSPIGYLEADEYTVLCTNFDTELSGGAFQDDTGKTITAYGNATNVMGNAVYNVQLPTVSDTTDTEIYMWYGNEDAYNNSIEAWQDMTGKALTYNGDVKLEYDSTLGRRMAVFDGTGDYFSLADSDDWNFGSGDFCVETKFNFTSVASDMAIFCQPNANGYSPVALIFYAASKKLQLLASSNGTGWQQLGSYTTATLDASTDYHIALVRSGNVFSVYIDGVVQLNATNALTLYNSTNLFLIGSNYNAQYINCSMRGFRITKGRARYTATFTPPTTFYIDGDDVVFCTNFDTVYDENYAMVHHMGDTLVDASGNGNNGTATGTTVLSTDYGKARGFNGSTERITTPKSTSISSEHTIVLQAAPSFQLPVSWNSANHKTLFTSSAASPLWNPGIWCVGNLLRGHVSTEYRDFTISWNDTSYRVVGQKWDGTENKCIFDGNIINGARVSFTPANTAAFIIGSSIVSGTDSNGWQGIILNFRVSDVARSDAWIKAESLALKNALAVITDFEKKGGSLFFGMNF